MSSLASVLRANPGLMIAVVLGLAFPIVLTLVGLLMRAAGASLRPMVFMAVLSAPLLVSFLVVGLIRARAPLAPSAAAGASGPGLALDGDRFARPETLYGPDVPADQVRDAKPVLVGVLDEARHAELAISGTGETVLVAEFADPEATKRASAAYWSMFRLTDSGGSEERGWRGRRGPGGDYAEILRTGRHLFVWTALSPEGCTKRRAMCTALAGLPPAGAASREPLLPGWQPLGAVLRLPAVKFPAMFLLVAFYVVWFFKGAAWAGSQPARPGSSPISASELMSRLEAVNELDVPFRVEPGERPGTCVATWRFADAKWIDLARAHGIRRIHRIRMALDADARVVRVTDDFAEFDASLGRGGASVRWKAGSGIILFQHEQQRVSGLQLDDQGRFRPELSYTYRFRLEEMKAPLREAVTRGGWVWRPTVWQGPAWLRWLTE